MQNKKIIVSLLLLLLLPACSWWGKKVEEVKMPALKLRLINVLDQATYDDAHIKGGTGIESVCVPFETLQEKAQGWDKTVPVVTYCSNYFCSASGSAARLLRQLGFEKVWAYEGGMAEWYQLSKKDASYAVEGPSKLSYLEILVAKPEHNPEDVQIITSEDLQKLIKQATLST